MTSFVGFPDIAVAQDQADGSVGAVVFSVDVSERHELDIAGDNAIADEFQFNPIIGAGLTAFARAGIDATIMPDGFAAISTP